MQLVQTFARYFLIQLILIEKFTTANRNNIKYLIYRYLSMSFCFVIISIDVDFYDDLFFFT